MSKIHIDLPTEVLTMTAEACGFQVAFDHSPGADEWTLSTGHGVKRVQYVGTKQSVCAFLTGYAAMQLQTTQILNKLILYMRARLDGRPDEEWSDARAGIILRDSNAIDMHTRLDGHRWSRPDEEWSDARAGIILRDSNAKLHPAYEAFRRQMRGRVYSEERLNDAWTYFKQGWPNGDEESETE